MHDEAELRVALAEGFEQGVEVVAAEVGGCADVDFAGELLAPGLEGGEAFFEDLLRLHAAAKTKGGGESVFNGGPSDARSGTGPTSQGRKTLKSGEKRGAYAEVVLRGLRALGSASGLASGPGVGSAGILLPWAAS